MPTAAFIDTNILLYAASDGRLEPEKTRLARRLLRSRPWAVSMQVVQEFHVNATRKVALGISSRHAAEVIDGLLERAVVDTTRELFVQAVVLQNRFMLHYYDAAICQAAILAGYRILFSEDMTSEEVYGQVMVLNPFDQGGRWIEDDPPRLDRLGWGEDGIHGASPSSP
jgi:predicted nucleic acid-binding protein